MVNIELGLDVLLGVVDVSNGENILGEKLIPTLQTRATTLNKPELIKFLKPQRYLCSSIPYTFISDDPQSIEDLNSRRFVVRLTLVDTDGNETQKIFDKQVIEQKLTHDGYISSETIRFSTQKNDESLLNSILYIKELEVGYTKLMSPQLSINNDSDNDKKTIQINWEGTLSTFQQDLINTFTPLIKVDFSNFRSNLITTINNGLKALKLDITNSNSSFVRDLQVILKLTYSL